MHTSPVALKFVEDEKNKTRSQIWLRRFLYFAAAALGYLLFLAAVLYIYYGDVGTSNQLTPDQKFDDGKSKS